MSREGEEWECALLLECDVLKIVLETLQTHSAALTNVPEVSAGPEGQHCLDNCLRGHCL